VALNLELDEELLREGLAREVVHSVQAARKAAGLEVSDSIALTLAGDAELIAAARAHERYVAGETLASELNFDGAEALGGAHTATIDGRPLRIGVERAR
jgi:isoleucyl-tRNA synthetase